MSDWIYNKPVFECDELNYDLLCYAPWSGHRAFVYDFMQYLKPNTVVELGSHYGCSAFTICQADKEFSLGCNMYFVDTWQGDDFTQKYGNDVYTVFSQTVERFYSKQNVNMLRMTFDEAVNCFEDGSIDVLHIDGSHHYDDVKHDFESWLPKVKGDGVIMLHDVSSDIVLGGIMGSHTYWNELKERFDYTFEFDFSWGLGLIFMSADKYEDFMSTVKPQSYQRYNNALDVDFKDRLRKNYFELKDCHIYIDDLLKQREVLNSHLDAYKKDIAAKESYINELTLQRQRDIKALTDSFEGERSQTLAAFKAEKQQLSAAYEQTEADTRAAYERDMATLKAAYEKMADEIKSSYEENISGKDSYINELEQRLASLEGKLNEQAVLADAYKRMYEKTLEAKAKVFCKGLKKGGK